jgi:sugar phosphate isomerase/epimerase
MAVYFLAAGLSIVLILGVPKSKPAESKVRIGYCASLREIDSVKAAAFDYVELRTSELANLSDAEFEEALGKIRKTGVPVPVTCLFVPGNIKLTGPNIDKGLQMSYVRKAFDRVSRLGVRVVTFGSGPARQVPDGFPKEEGFRQLVEFGKRIAPEARARNITVAIEPQRRQECNIINTAAN